jgi:hypothetical protein
VRRMVHRAELARHLGVATLSCDVSRFNATARTASSIEPLKKG